MTTEQVLLLVGAIVVFDLLTVACLLRWARRKASAVAEVLHSEISRPGERMIFAPESGSYRGATRGYGFVKGNAVIALTDKRLVIRMLAGREIEVPVSEIEEVEGNKWFMGSYKNGITHVILHLRDGANVGFFVKNPDLWMQTIRSLIGR